jgi:hypothetical protein
MRRVTIAVIDTMLIAPPNSSLATLGSHVGLPKLEIMAGYSIEDMARYREEQPEAFDAYARMDAEIAARYATKILDLLKTLGIAGRAPTVSAAGAAMFKRLFSKKEDWLAFLGQDTGPNSDKRRHWRPASHLASFMQSAAGSYHGGLNTIYFVGYSPPGRVVLDADLRGAYTTALSAIGYPDWQSARYTKSLADLAVVDEAMTFCQVRFKFPADAKFPCLPIRSGDKRALIFPLEGESWTCGPELVTALAMGAVIEVTHGYRVDWIPDRANPFASFSHKIAEGRKAAKASGDAMLELLFKLLGNSLYGKVSQGVSSKRPIADDVEDHRVFNAEAGEMTDLPPSSITCPAIAAWATSLVRAVMSEALYRLPSTAIALQATTDGILYVGAESDIDISGSVALAFRRACALVVGEPNPPIWDIKHRLPRVLTFKTRGMISVVPEGWTGDIHLAKAGARLPDYLKTDVDRTRFAEQLYRGRNYDTKFERRDLTSLSKQHKMDCDLTSEIVKVQLSWDFDWKNEPIEPVADIEGVISFATRPWRTLEDFEKYRENFEDWKRTERRVLKTSHDYADTMGWPGIRRTRKALRTNSRGVLPNLARAIVAIVVRLPLRERPSYKRIAEIFARHTGCNVTENHIKNIRAKRDQIPLQCVSQLSTADIELAHIYGSNPIAVEQMRSSIIPGSIAERQFTEIWERGVPAPVLTIVNDCCDDSSEFVGAMESLVAVAGGHSAAVQGWRPDRMAKSLKQKPASLAERAALARIERVIEPARAEQTIVAPDQPRTELTRLDQARVDDGFAPGWSTGVTVVGIAASRSLLVKGLSTSVATRSLPGSTRSARASGDERKKSRRVGRSI